MSVSTVLTLLMWLIAAVLICFVGIWLVTTGIRGRKLNDHPSCGRCGYDLAGHDAGVSSCPECARDLTEEGALDDAVRTIRLIRIVIGLALLVVAAGAGVWGLSPNRRTIVFMEYTPNFVLTAWMDNSIDWLREATLDEIFRRVALGELSDAHRFALAEEALQLQGDYTIEWDHRYGLLIEDALHDGILPPDEWRRYLEQQLPVAASASDLYLAHPGDRLSLAMPYFDVRRAPNSRFTIDQCICELRMRGQVIPHRKVFFNTQSRWAPNGVDLLRASVSFTLDEDLKPGLAVVDAHFTFTLIDNLDENEPVELNIQQAFDIDVKCATEPLIEADASLAAANNIAACFECRQRDPAFKLNTNEHDLEIIVHRPPCNLAFKVFLVCGDTEFKIGDLTATNTVDQAHSSVSIDLSPESVYRGVFMKQLEATGAATLRFRTDSSLANRFRGRVSDDWRIWDGEFTIDVPFKLPE